MNDKDRDLIAQVLRAAGQAGEKGFDYLVRFTFTSAITEILSTSAVLALCFYVWRLLQAWKPKDSFDNDMAHAARGAGSVIVLVVAAICISSIGSSLAAVFSPEGAAIHSVLK